MCGGYGTLPVTWSLAPPWACRSHHSTAPRNRSGPCVGTKLLKENSSCNTQLLNKRNGELRTPRHPHVLPSHARDPLFAFLISPAPSPALHCQRKLYDEEHDIRPCGNDTEGATLNPQPPDSASHRPAAHQTRLPRIAVPFWTKFGDHPIRTLKSLPFMT